MSDTPPNQQPIASQLTSLQTEVSETTLPLPRKSPSLSSLSECGSDDRSIEEQFFEAAEEVEVRETASESRQSSSASSSRRNAAASPIAGVDPDDSLQQGIDVAMKAVRLFLNSDFEEIEKLLHHKRHSLMYASEGYAAIQYLRAIMSFTKESMGDAQLAADSTINLAMHYRKQRGVGSLLSSPGSRSASRSSLPQAAKDAAESQGHGHLRHRRSGSSMGPGKDAHSKHGSAKSWFRLDSPRLALRSKKDKQRGSTPSSVDTASVSTSASVSSMESAVSALSNAEQKPPFDQAVLDASYGELQMLNELDLAASAETEEQEVLDKQPQRSWASGIAGVADSLIGIVRAGSQAVGISKPEWHALKSMTPTQRHAELVHAEAYLLRAMLNVAMGDGVLSVLKEGWHVRSSYATYRNCYAFIQDAHANGETVDDHFVSGTYLGIGVFNLVLSMLPARLLRFVELVGFSADRKLGLELLAIAAGWRSDPQLADLLEPPPKDTESIHPCGYGLRSEFCAMVLEVYHAFLCPNMNLGYPNMPLTQAVLPTAVDENPKGLIFMYFMALLHMTRRQIDDAIDVFSTLINLSKGAVQKLSPNLKFKDIDSFSVSAIVEDELVVELAALKASDTKPDSSVQKPSTTSVAGSQPKDAEEWRQLQYLGYWERSLCCMSLGWWMDAARGFNKLRKENNWNKAVYTYSLACCIWEEYLVISGGTAPTEESELTEEQRRLLGIVRNLMAMVPRLQRKVAGKSIPIEKFVIRKARKFQEQGDFLMRPGVELVASWNLFGKIPYYRLQALRGEIDTSIAELSQHQKQEDGSNGKPYRHKYYYDDLATLLLLKANCLHEISMPSCIYNLKPPAADEQEAKENAAKAQADEAVQMQPELSLAAADTYLRLLRLSPLIERDHYLVATARFCLGSLYLSAHAIDSEWAGLARAQWKCVVGGKPITAAPFLSLEEYRLHKDRLQRDEKEGDGTKNDAFAAYGCLVEEQILQNSGHASLRFYEDGYTVSGWSHCPAYWSDSKKYSLQNALEVRTFNSENRLSEALASSKAGI